jgi:hypothetical protein
MTEGPRAGNGEVSFTLPHLLGGGGFRLAGRDLLLAVVLLALGAAAITVQWITIASFQAGIARDVARVFAAADQARREREEILALLRLRTCSEVWTEAGRTYDARVRERIERTWSAVCLPAPKGDPR